MKGTNIMINKSNDEKIEGKKVHSDKKPKKTVVDSLMLDKAADLAMVTLTSDERNTILPELEALFNFADTLSEIDTDGVDITVHATHLENVLRKDETAKAFERQELLKNTPSTINGYISAPKVM